MGCRHAQTCQNEEGADEADSEPNEPQDLLRIREQPRNGEDAQVPEEAGNEVCREKQYRFPPDHAATLPRLT